VQAPEVEVRLAREADLPSIVELVSLCLGPGSVPRSPAFWRWKHERNPFGPSPVLLAEAGGEIVGLRAFLRWRLRSGDRDVEAVRAVDTATHPDWRGRGIFSRLTRELADREAGRGTALVFNTPNASSGAGYRKMGWGRVGRVPLLVRPIRPLALVGSGASREGRRRPEVLEPGLDALPSVDELLELPWLDEFLASVEVERSDRRLRTPLGREYLRWRYGEVPGMEYRALWSGEGRRAAAVVVRARRRGRFREVVVSEVLAPAGRAGIGVAARLLRRLASRVDADYLAAALSPATPERKAAYRAGFLPAPFVGPPLFVRELTATSDAPNPARRASWRFSAGSIEIF
jgi:GNAT superfamily N-acetyltransferase